MANRYKDPDELNKRYIPENNGRLDEDEGEEIPEEELTEEEREMVKTLGNITAEGWQKILEWTMDEEDYTLSDEEFHVKNIIAKLNTALRQEGELAYAIRLGVANRVTPKEAVLIIQRLKKKPEEGTNIPPDILDMIYAKAKEYKG